MSTRASEILLLALLVVIIGFTRVYYGVAEGPMFVWKGEFGFKDTFVNLSDIERMPPQEATKEYPAVLFQLEEMGLVEDHTRPHVRRPRARDGGANNSASGNVNQPASSSAAPDAENGAAPAPAALPATAPQAANH